MGSGIIMYDIPSIRTDYDEYTIRASSKLSNNQPYTFDAYSNDPDSVVLNYLVFKGKSRAIEPRAHAMAVTQFSTVTNRDGDILKRVIGIQDGTRVIYDSHLIDGQRSAFDVAKDAFGNTYAIKEGDIIRVSSVPLTGYVDSVQLLYRRDMVNPAYPDSNQGHLVGTTGTFSSDVSNSNPFSVSRNALDTQNVRIYGNGEFKVYYGWVYKKSSSIITVTSQDLSRTQYSADNNEHLTSSFNISIYGKYSAIDYYGPETDARLGTSEDIRAYKDVGSDCTRVMVINFYGEPNQLIVMNGGR